MTDYLSLIKEPIKSELEQFISLFNASLTHEGKLQEEIFARIRNRAGKRMRPMLIMLMAKNYGMVTDATGADRLQSMPFTTTRWLCSLATISCRRRCCTFR